MEGSHRRHSARIQAIAMRTTLTTTLIVIALALAARGEEPHTFRGKTVEGWLAVFRDEASTDVQRREAAVMLGCFGPEAGAAAPGLIDAVRRGPLREEAVDALVSIGVGAEVTVPILIDRFVKRGCQHLTGQGTFVLDVSIDKALARVGEPAVPALVKILDGPDENMRVCAAYALREIGPAARPAVPSLIRAIRPSDPQWGPGVLAMNAMQALGRIGPAAREAIPILNRRLDQQDTSDIVAVIALDRIGAPPARTLVDRLLRDGDSFVAFEMSWLGPKAREAAPALRAALADKRRQVRISAAVALGFIDPAAAEAVPVLLEALKYRNDEEIDVGDVPGALARLGPRAKAALPVLIDLVKKGDEDERLVKTLVQIDPEGKECVPALIAALKQGNADVVDNAANSLAVLGPRAKDAVPALAATMARDDLGRMNSGEWDPRVSAVRAIGRIGPAARSAIPALIGVVRARPTAQRPAGQPDAIDVEDDREVAAAAVAVLGSFGAESRAAIPALIDSLKMSEGDDPYGRLHQEAALALGRIGRDARAAIPVLRDVLAKDVRVSRCQAEIVVALDGLAPDGKELAERWLATPRVARRDRRMQFGLEDRVMVLGSMGRTSFEGDWLTRRYLERLDDRLAHGHPNDRDPFEHGEWLLESFGRLGAAGRLAIPRLKELREHHDPFVRMWASEALKRISPHE
jgi:HEAT repeat protein